MNALAGGPGWQALEVAHGRNTVRGTQPQSKGLFQPRPNAPRLAAPPRGGVLRKIDVVANSTLPGISQQSQEPTAFSDAASPANDYNEARMRVTGNQSQEVSPIAGHQHCLLRVREPENGKVVSLRRQHLSQPCNGMALLRGDAPNRIRHILVEQEGHAPVSAI